MGVLCYEPASERLIVEQVYDHHGNVGVGSVPLLAFEAWEHAYYLQYRNVRPDFVKAMWEVVNWPDVAARYGAALAGENPEFFWQTMRRVVGEAQTGADPARTIAELVFGLAALSGILADDLAECTGRDRAAVIAEIHRAHLAT